MNGTIKCEDGFREALRMNRRSIVGKNLTIRCPGGFREAFKMNRRPLKPFNYWKKFNNKASRWV